MAVPAYATDLTDIYTDTGNFILVGGGRVTDVETDDYIQGANCWSHDPFSSGIEGGVHDTVSAETIATDDAVFIWTKCDVAATLATHAAGGIQCLIGDAATALKCFYALGSDDYQYGGWKCIPIDPTKTPSTNIGSPSGVWDHFGVRWNVPSTGAAKGYPMKIDAMRHGRQVEVTAGEIANPATWDATAVYDSDSTRQWGICQPTNTGAALQGLLYWGTAAASVYSRDSNRTIVLIDTEWTSTDFTQILFAHASNDVVWDNVGLIALGTNNRGIIDVTANGTVTWTNSVFQGIGTTTMLTNSTFDGSKWVGTNQIDGGGGSLLGAQILVPTVAADTGALLWDVATDPDGFLDNMTISKGAAAHHAIDFGTNISSALTEITLRGIEFTGFSATEDADDSHVRFLATSGALTLNLVDCTVDGAGASAANFSIDDAAGMTVTPVFDTIPLKVTVTDAVSGALLTKARVHLHKEGDTGTVYFNDETGVDGIVSTNIAYPGDTAVVGWVREFDVVGIDYVQKDISGTITSTGFDIAVQLERYD